MLRAHIARIPVRIASDDTHIFQFGILMPALKTNITIHNTSPGKAKAKVSPDSHLVGKPTLDPTKATKALAGIQLGIDIIVRSESAVLQGNTSSVPPFAGALKGKKKGIF